MTDDELPPAEAPRLQTERREDRGLPEWRHGQVLIKAGVAGLVIVGLLLLSYGAWATRRIDQRSGQTHVVACEAVRLLAVEQAQVGRLTGILEDGVAVLIASPEAQPELLAELEATLGAVDVKQPLPEGVRHLRCPA